MLKSNQDWTFPNMCIGTLSFWKVALFGRRMGQYPTRDYSKIAWFYSKEDWSYIKGKWWSNILLTNKYSIYFPGVHIILSTLGICVTNARVRSVNTIQDSWVLSYIVKNNVVKIATEPLTRDLFLFGTNTIFLFVLNIFTLFLPFLFFVYCMF